MSTAEQLAVLIGQRRTFETEAERAAYVLGYNDAFARAAVIVRTAGVVGSGDGLAGRTIRAATEALASALESSGRLT